MAGRTFIRQAIQIRNSDLYDDVITSGPTMESAGASIEFDLNALRTMARLTHGQPDWFTPPTRTNESLNTDLQSIEQLIIPCSAHVLTKITVPAAQNWVLLNVAGAEAPTEVAAVGATTEGAIVAQSALSGAGFDVHELIEVAGQNAVSPLNLLIVRDGTTAQPIQSSGKDVFGLLQYESTGVDGGTFNDVSGGNRVKISFVRFNASNNDLEAVPVADIENATLDYNYLFQRQFQNVNRNCFNNSRGFVDQVAGAVDVTLDNAIDNQSGPATQAQNIEWRIDDSLTLRWQTSDGLRDLLRIAPAAGGDTLEANVDDLDVNTTNPADFSEGIRVDTGGEELRLGVTPGVVESQGANDLRFLGANELLFDDVNQPGSTWSDPLGIKLSEVSQDWDDYIAAVGQVSLLKGIANAAASSGGTRSRFVACVTTAIPQDTAIDGSPGTPNLDAQLGDYSGANFVADVENFVNGELMRNGANASTTFDVYPSAVVAEQQVGVFFAKFPLSVGDVLQQFISA